MQSAQLSSKAARGSGAAESGRPIKQGVGRRRTGPATSDSLCCAPPTGLSLAIPDLDASIPYVLETPRSRRLGVKLAVGLLDAGVVPTAAPELANDPIAASKVFLEQWVKRELQGLSTLALHFRLLIRNTDSWGHRLSDDAQGEAQVAWYSEVQPFVVGQALERLEAIHEGLGALVLTIIERKCHHLPVFTPSDVLSVVTDFHWYGHKDETGALEENCSTEEEKEAMRAEMITRADLDAAFPKWATQWPTVRRTAALKVLKRAAQGANSPLVRRVASNALALNALTPVEQYRAQGEGWFIGYGAVLCWSSEDVATRAFDDMANHAMEAEFVDWCGEAELDLREPDSIKSWIARMKPVFESVKLIDALITDLSAGNWTKVKKGFV